MTNHEPLVNPRRDLFLAMILEDDDAKRAELRRQYIERLNADAKTATANAYR